MNRIDAGGSLPNSTSLILSILSIPVWFVSLDKGDANP